MIHDIVGSGAVKNLVKDAGYLGSLGRCSGTHVARLAVR